MKVIFPLPVVLVSSGRIGGQFLSQDAFRNQSLDNCLGPLCLNTESTPVWGYVRSVDQNHFSVAVLDPVRFY